MKIHISIISFLLILATVSCGSKTSERVNEQTDTETFSVVESDSIVVVEGDTIKMAVKENRDETPFEPETYGKKSDAYIVVDKPNLKLYVIEHNDTLFKGPICAGRNYGDKKGKDDRRTPEGNFKITNIHDASGWLYHTDDGRWVPHVYGPWFLRLDAKGWQGIGIHGTNAPAQIGQRRSKGCIRMKNEDIRKVHDLAFVGMEVKVLPDNGKTVKNQSGSMPETSVRDTVAVASEKNIESGGEEEILEENIKEEIENPAPIKPEPSMKDTIN